MWGFGCRVSGFRGQTLNPKPGLFGGLSALGLVLEGWLVALGTVGKKFSES